MTSKRLYVAGLPPARTYIRAALVTGFDGRFVPDKKGGHSHMTQGGAAASTGYSSGQLASIFVSALLGYAMDGYNLLILSFLMPYIATTMHLSEVSIGLVFSMQLAASMLGGVVFGWIGDAVGRRNALMLSIIVYSVGALFSGLSGSFGALLLFRFLTGLGLGGEWGSGMVLFNEAWSARRRGLGASIIQSSFLMGISLAGIVAAGIISSHGPTGWHLALETGALPIVLVLLIRFWMPESRLWKEYQAAKKAGTLPPEKMKESVPLVEIFRGRALPWTIAGLLMVAGFMLAFYGVVPFIPTIIIKVYHAGPAVFAQVNTAVTWIAIVFYIAFGWISDSWGRKRTFLIPGVLMLAGAVALFVATQSRAPYPGAIWGWGLFLAYLLWYVGTSASALFGVWLSEVFPVEVRNTAVSVTYMIGRGASAIAPVLVPVIGGAVLGVGIGVIALVGAVVMLIFGLTLPETRGRVFHVVEDVAGSQSA